MYPKFKQGQRERGTSARGLQRISDGASMAETLSVRGPFLEKTSSRVTSEIRINMEALLNYVRPRIPSRVAEVITTHSQVDDITGFWTVRRFSQGTTSGPHILAAIDPIAGRDSMTQNMTLGSPEFIAVGGSGGVVFVLNVVSTRTEDITGYTVLDAVTLAPIGDRVELPGRTFWKSIDGDASTVLVARSVTIFVNNDEVVPKSGSNSITDIAGISGDGVTSWIANQDRLYFMRTEDMKATAFININDDTVNSATAAGGQTVKSFEVLDVAGKGLTCSVLMRLTFPDLVEPGSSGQPVPTLYYYLFHHGLVDGQVKLTGHTYLGSRNRYLSIGGGNA